MSEGGWGQKGRKECLNERRVAMHAVGSAGARFSVNCVCFCPSLFFLQLWRWCYNESKQLGTLYKLLLNQMTWGKLLMACGLICFYSSRNSFINVN